MISDYEVKRDAFSQVKNITWEDVALKLDYEVIEKTHRVLNRPSQPPTFITQNDYLPNTIGKAYDEVCDAYNSKLAIHVYASFDPNATVFSRHSDSMDVLIVQAIGKMYYDLDDGSRVTLDPGDSLFMKRGVYHNPTVIEPRVTLSFSWLDK